MKIRNAELKESALLATIARDAVRAGGYPEDWITHSHSDLSISTDSIEKRQVYVADESGELQGFYALATDGSTLEQLWVAPAYFGTGVGKELFLHAMERSLRGSV